MVSEHTVGFEPADRLAQDRDSVRRRFWIKLKRVIAKLPFAEDLLAAYYCAFDKQTPRHVQAALLGAIAYFILPFDFIPDMLPVLGFTDDAAVLAQCDQDTGAGQITGAITIPDTLPATLLPGTRLRCAGARMARDRLVHAAGVNRVDALRRSHPRTLAPWQQRISRQRRVWRDGITAGIGSGQAVAALFSIQRAKCFVGTRDHRESCFDRLTHNWRVIR